MVAKSGRPKGGSQKGKVSQGRFSATLLPESSKIPFTLMGKWPPRKKDSSSKSCLPFWPAFNVADCLTSKDVEGCYVKLASSEQWFTDYVRLTGISNAVHKKLAKQLAGQWHNLFLDQVKKARKEYMSRAKSEHGVQWMRRAIDEDQPDVVMRVWKHFGPAVVNVIADKHELTILNLGKPMFVKVDASFCEWLQVSLLTSAMSSTTRDDDDEAAGSQPSTLQRPRLAVPHDARGKISWCASEQRYLLHVKKPKHDSTKDLNGQSFAVKKDLFGEDYVKDKSNALARAIATWNECDGSNRARIEEFQDESAQQASTESSSRMTDSQEALTGDSQSSAQAD